MLQKRLTHALKSAKSDEIAIKVRSEYKIVEMTAVDIVASILRYIAEVIADQQKVDSTLHFIEKIVLTVPRTFSRGHQMAAMRAAKRAARAGYLPEKLLIISEPEAAVCSHLFDKTIALSGHILVIDIGANAFNIAIVKVK